MKEGNKKGSSVEYGLQIKCDGNNKKHALMFH